MSEPTIHARLLAARQEMTHPRLTGHNPHFDSSFVPRDEVLGVVNPALAAHGLMLSQGMGEGALVTRVIAADGAEIVLSRWPIHPDSNPQKYGAAVTYASRFSLMQAFGFAGEKDDDGNTAAAPVPPEKPTAAAAYALRDAIGMDEDAWIAALEWAAGHNSIDDFTDAELDKLMRGLRTKQAQASK